MMKRWRRTLNTNKNYVGLVSTVRITVSKTEGGWVRIPQPMLCRYSSMDRMQSYEL